MATSNFNSRTTKSISSSVTIVKKISNMKEMWFLTSKRFTLEKMSVNARFVELN